MNMVRLLPVVALGYALAAGSPSPAQQFLLPEDLSPENLNRNLLGADGFSERDRVRSGRNSVSVTAEAVVASPGAVLRALDRISGEITDLELTVGETATYADRLTVTLQDCRYPEDDPSSNAYALLTITDRLRDGPIFQGWMIAASPALNALDHVRYDVWVLRCNIS